jgi:hypothetical protein
MDIERHGRRILAGERFTAKGAEDAKKKENKSMSLQSMLQVDFSSFGA